MANSGNIRVNLNGTDRHIRAVRNGTEDYRTPLRQSGIYMEGSIGRRFRSASWTPLAPATIKIHPRRAGGKPLNDTGRLKMSVTSGSTKTVTDKMLRYGSNLKYARIHNYGGRTGWGTVIPQREFLYFDTKDERAIKRIFSDYIEGLG